MSSFMNKMLNMVGFGGEEYEEDIYEEDTTLDYEPSVFDRLNERRNNKVVKIHNSSAQMRVVVIQPESFEEARDITNHLKSKKPIVVNLESVEKQVARRIIDFLSGAVFALDGDIQKVSNGIFVIAPNNVDIMSDVIKNETRAFPWS